MIHRKQFSYFFFTGGLFAVFLFFVVYVFSQSIGGNLYPDPRNYAPNFWFDSQEKYYPADPLRFYYDKNLNELSGEMAVKTYKALPLQEKLNNFVVFYDVKDLGNELVYQYWLFYVFNDSDNDHYGDWEFVQVYINKKDKSISKVLASAHIGTTTRAIFAHGEVLSPQFDRPIILVEKGSHAGCIDANGDGLFDRFTDNTNWYNSYCSLWSRDWSKEDQKNGVKVFHDSPYYKLRPLSELEQKIGDKDLISKEKSPTLGMVPLNTPFGITIPKLGITSDKFYALKLGGAPPENAWLKLEYADPEKASPITVAKITNFIGSKINDGVDKTREFAMEQAANFQNFVSAAAYKARDITVSTYQTVSDAGKTILANIQSVFAGLGITARNFASAALSTFGQTLNQSPSRISGHGTWQTPPALTNQVAQIPTSVILEDNSSEDATAEEEIFYNSVFVSRSNDIKAMSGDEMALWAEFQNSGNTNWDRNSVSLNITTSPPSQFYHPGWLTQRRPTLLDQFRVRPDEVGRFSFPIKIPDQEPGQQKLSLRPVYQDSAGFHWLGADIVTWLVNVISKQEEPEQVDVTSGISQEINAPQEDEEQPQIVEKVHDPEEEEAVGPQEGDTTEEEPATNIFTFPGHFSGGGGSQPQDTSEENQENPPEEEQEGYEEEPPQEEPEPEPEQESEPEPATPEEGEPRPDESGREPEPQDTQSPDTILDIFPDILTNQTNAVFEFHSTEEDSTFECLLDDAEWWAGCLSPSSFSNLFDGLHRFFVRAIDGAGNTDESPADHNWEVKTKAPTPFIRLADDYLPVNLSFTILWGLEDQEKEDELDFFELEFSDTESEEWSPVELNEEERESRAKTFNDLEDETTYYIRIRTVDTLSNKSDWQDIAVDINTRAIVINEVGYRGTNASYLDEWIELLNVSSRDISLDGWILAIGENKKHKIPLEGTIPAHGFYLLERDVESRNSDQVILDIEADLPYHGAINDGKVIMWLIAPTGNTVDYVEKVWSDNPDERKSMERVSPYVLGYDRNNWLLNDTETTNGLDADKNPILGTPKAKNSVYLLYHSLFLVPSITENTTFFKERGPYVVYDTLTVEEGVTLIVEPGVIFHFKKSDSRFLIDGTLLSRGTAEDEIVYTSIYDSEYEGSGIAGPGAWKWIVFSQKSNGSVFEYSRIRYAGSYQTGYRSDNAGMIVSGTDLVFRNSIFEHILIKGFIIWSSSVTIDGSKFLHNNSSYDTTGLIIENESDVEISNSEFRDNTIGVYIKDANEVPVSDSVFAGNDEPFRVFDGGYPIFSGENVFSENGFNGVTISGTIEEDTTWYSGITYIVYYDVEVADAATLTIEPGAIIKFKRSSSYLDVYGTIYAVSEAENPIVFTSLSDDEYGGDAQSDGETSGVPGAWKWIRVLGTSENSIFENVIIRYAGSYITGFRSNNAALWIGADVTIRNLLLEHGLIYGLRIGCAGCVVENSIFQHMNSARDSTAIEINGSPTLRNIQIIDNSIGIWVNEDSSPTFENIYFKENTQKTIPEDLIF